ncbi:MAG: cupin domain-containing protein [Chloroflexia bacterium]|nr:cupin domain-containing protein [Chloroflexia bacterium]
MSDDASPAITAQQVMDLLGMKPLTFEGGYFAETHRAGALAPEHVPWAPTDHRSLKTAIYYMLTPDTMSAMHLLPGDEVFHHYLGDPVQQLQLFPDGAGEMVTIGSNLLAGERPQVVVPGGVWQGALLVPERFGFALMGTTMAPGFDHRDFQPGSFTMLRERFPDWENEIAARLPSRT